MFLLSARRGPPGGQRRRPRWLIRLGPWPRRCLAVALLAAAAVAASRPDGDVRASRPHPSIRIVVAAHPLPAGRVIRAGDVRLVRWPAELAPPGALRAPAALVGKSLAGSVHQGEALTDLDTIGPSLARSLAGADAAAVPIRIANPDVVRLLRPGDAIDVLAASPGHRSATLVADRVRVIAAPTADSDSPDGATIVVVTSRDTARRIAGISSDSQITVTLRAA